MLMEWNPKAPPSLWDWGPHPDFPIHSVSSTISSINSPVVQDSPPMGLKLGKRTYFEDTAPAPAPAPAPAQATNSASSSPSALVKRTRASSVQLYRCQVEHCNADLTAAKEYHRKHRVCELHSKSPRVVIVGMDKRFCQQCSRFHDLAAFDEKKRSCRKRLSDHNARRRKPHPGTISFGSGGSASYDNIHQMNLLASRVALGPIRQPANSTWEGSFDFKLSDMKSPWTKSTKVDSEGQILLSGSDLTNAYSTLRHDLGRIFPYKNTAEVLNQGPEASTVASSLNRAPDLRHAFSLLSNGSLVTTGPGQTSSISQPVLTNQSSLTQHTTHMMNSASDCWQDEQPLAQPSRVSPFSMPNNGSQFQEFQLLKSPYETSFFSSSEIQ